MHRFLLVLFQILWVLSVGVALMIAVDASLPVWPKHVAGLYLVGSAYGAWRWL